MEIQDVIDKFQKLIAEGKGVEDGMTLENIAIDALALKQKLDYPQYEYKYLSAYANRKQVFATQFIKAKSSAEKPLSDNLSEQTAEITPEAIEAREQENKALELSMRTKALAQDIYELILLCKSKAGIKAKEMGQS